MALKYPIFDLTNYDDVLSATYGGVYCFLTQKILYIYIYVYVYIYREREDRESVQVQSGMSSDLLASLYIDTDKETDS